jgi:hypothetical protein
MSEGAWNFLWNLGLVVGFVGVPAMFGFYAGASMEAATKAPLLPWRLLFCGFGAVVGLFAAWRTLAPKVTRRRE